MKTLNLLESMLDTTKDAFKKAVEAESHGTAKSVLEEIERITELICKVNPIKTDLVFETTTSVHEAMEQLRYELKEANEIIRERDRRVGYLEAELKEAKADAVVLREILSGTEEERCQLSGRLERQDELVEILRSEIRGYKKNLQHEINESQKQKEKLEKSKVYVDDLKNDNRQLRSQLDRQTEIISNLRSNIKTPDVQKPEDGK